jgi:hypothetical protein
MELSRREFAGLLGTGALTLGGLGWSPEEAYAAAPSRKVTTFLEKLGEAPAKIAGGYSTIVLIPDTQMLVQAAAKKPDQYEKFLNGEKVKDGKDGMRTWIINNRKTKENIKAVISLGDIVNDTGEDYVEAQFGKAKKIYGHLKDLKESPVTTIALPGNHDYDEGPKVGNRWLVNYEKYLKNVNSPWTGVWDGFGGEKQGVNAYYKLPLGDKEFIIITLEYLPRPKVVQWAKDVITKNKTTPIIIVTHGYESSGHKGIHLLTDQDPGGFRDPITNAGALEETLVEPHSNVLMVFSGHVPIDTLKKREITRPPVNGKPTPSAFSFLADMQLMEEEIIYGPRIGDAGYPKGGVPVPYTTVPLGMIVIVRIANATNSEGKKKVQLVYYSTAQEKYLKNFGVGNSGEYIVDIKMP